MRGAAASGMLSVMNRALLFVLALSCLIPTRLRAQSLEEMFGISPAELISESQRQQARYEAELAVRRVRKARVAALKEFVGLAQTSRQDVRCVVAAVSAHLGVAVPAGEPPAVYRASQTILEDYQSLYYAAVGAQDTPQAVKTGYFPGANVIFIEDASSAYGAGRSIDDALAGQVALYVQHRALGRNPSSAQARASAAEVERWFHAAYTVPKQTACR